MVGKLELFMMVSPFMVVGVELAGTGSTLQSKNHGGLRSWTNRLMRI